MTTKKDRTIKTNYPNLKPPKYSVQYACKNCGWSGVLKFAKGIKALSNMTCPKCECSTADKQIALPYVPKIRLRPKDEEPFIPVPIIPRDIPPCPGELPEPYPMRPNPYDPWNVPHKPDRPWDVPARPYLGDIGNDIDSETRWREDMICIDEPDTGLGLMPKTRENFRAHECGVRDW